MRTLYATVFQQVKRSELQMMTAAEIVTYLEGVLAEAYALYDVHKGKQAAEAYAYLLKTSTIEQLLDAIKQG